MEHLAVVVLHDSPPLCFSLAGCSGPFPQHSVWAAAPSPAPAGSDPVSLLGWSFFACCYFGAQCSEAFADFPLKLIDI